MKNIITNFLIFSALLFSTFISAQSAQKNFINYQGVARSASGDILADESINIQIAIKFGAPDVAASYVENHAITTNTNGVFALLIGDGVPVTGDFNTLQWGGIASYVTVSLNGAEMGTNELMAVPYAITSGDTRWFSNGDDIENMNSGNVGIDRTPTAKLDVNGDLKLENGTSVNEISTDGTLASNSNNAVPTERAVKTYVDNATAVSTPIVFKVRGNGFAVKDLDANTTIETDIWDIRTYDTRNAFNTTTKRFVAPESGYYYLHAVVRQSNAVTTSFFRISFNVDTGVDFTQIVDGDDVKTDVSGIYFLNVGQEVFVSLRNFGAGDVRIDGTGSWFEGYKIN
ncbi:hypothetical protein D1818_18870 [Aquimarina sp. BL5]|uniref:hypothetical protein n=1 Tax=Aquimarina sp. BL5 TaxID=1714860 RepID=UPI000E4AFF10|nr:hypothetical protein [Aquimarina sp. BL5]AXT52787.1 hypothetical protein D1818_18870 [Aquimarina sp. BL5]RKN03734.1 hypothetical protein D7036_13215 [Aquimarina sp. BL5]